MRTKYSIMVCLIITALGSALVLSDLLPNPVIILLMLGGGCASAYYMGLSAQRDRILSELDFVIKAEHIIRSCNSADILSNNLNNLIKKLTGAEGVYFFFQPDEAIIIDTVDEKMIKDVISEVMELKQTIFLSNYKDGQFRNILDAFKIKEVMVLPVLWKQDIMGVLFVLSNSLGMLNYKRESAERIALCAGDMIYQYRTRDLQHRRDIAIIKAMINTVDSRMQFFDGHSSRVAAAAALMAARLSLSDEETESLKYAALLHDAGKIRVDFNSAETNDQMAQHPVLGAEIMPEDDFFMPIREAILSHHERYDGQGYPQGLIRNDIPFLARIIAVSDVYDALVRLCPEEQRLNHTQAIKTIKKATGTLFDPLVVVAFEEVSEEIKKLYF